MPIPAQPYPPSYGYPPNQYPPQQPQAEYVGFWARLIAYIADGVLLTAIMFVLSFLLRTIGFFDSFTERDFEAFSNIAGFIVSIIYTLGFWASKQATPGKMAFKAKIVDATTLGEPSGGQLIGRYLAYIISAIPLCLGFLWVAFDDKKRGWHDMLAGTLVITHK
ncbi:MAG: RDD family protein [Helicobacteraceae bacterium]|nr:RDD family protein [Helicobacteraceae bacterium]